VEWFVNPLTRQKWSYERSIAVARAQVEAQHLRDISRCEQARDAFWQEQLAAIRAERDAAHQGIARLRAALQGLRDDIDSGSWAARNDASKRAEHALRQIIDAALTTPEPQG
jgi:hypothetical protein